MSDEETSAPASGNTTPLRVVKGDPTVEELAALVTVVSAMSAGAQAAADKPGPRPEWAAHHRKLRGTHRHGPGAWRASAR